MTFIPQVRSPIKTMKIDARVETSPFKLTIKNLYDDTKPINTELTVDPNDGSLDFNMNYDISKSSLSNTNTILKEKIKNTSVTKWIDTRRLFCFKLNF